MSASLVGSEMCIRDSASPSLACPVLAESRDLDPLTRRPCADFRRRVGTVSYTHLTLPTICSV
eukprot:11013873-Alexandrium_andersonii.AAC.1